MAASLGRIGKALLKFFKPLRYAAAHLPGRSYQWSSKPKLPSPESGHPDFRLVKFKEHAENPASTAAENSVGENAAPEEPQLEPEKSKQWLELVIHLLGTCRRASDKMRKRAGVNSYQKALLSKGTHKLRATGNIIDTELEGDKGRESA